MKSVYYTGLICKLQNPLNTMDLTGELEDKNFFTTRGDSRISLQVAKNKYTVAFDRESRFLIDDVDTPHKLSYLLTKPLKMGYTYNDEGTFKFVLQEVTATEDDNHELGIADYYKYFPKYEDISYYAISKTSSSPPSSPSETSTDWSTTEPDIPDGWYLWMAVARVYTDGTYSWGDAVCLNATAAYKESGGRKVWI